MSSYLDPYEFKSLIELEDCFSNILFIDKNHSYKMDGKLANSSPTTLIRKYQKPFDTMKFANFVAMRDGFDVKVVLDLWEYKKNYSTLKGSELHKFVENFFQRKQTTINRPMLNSFILENFGSINAKEVENYYKEFALLIKNFYSFYDYWKEDHIHLKSEFVIGDKITKVCGTIDELCFNKKTKELIVFDWKTNLEIAKKSKYKEKMLPPFKHLDKCELTTYSLQLHLYCLILERNTPFFVGTPKIVWLTGQDDYEIIDCLDLRKEAELILKESFAEDDYK